MGNVKDRAENVPGDVPGGVGLTVKLSTDHQQWLLNGEDAGDKNDVAL